MMCESNKSVHYFYNSEVKEFYINEITTVLDSSKITKEIAEEFQLFKKLIKQKETRKV